MKITIRQARTPMSGPEICLSAFSLKARANAGPLLHPGPMSGLIAPASALPYKSTVFHTNFVSAVAPR